MSIWYLSVLLTTQLQMSLNENFMAVLKVLVVGKM
jgi:hypothetical protein